MNELILLTLLIMGCVAAAWLGKSIGKGIAEDQKIRELKERYRN